MALFNSFRIFVLLVVGIAAYFMVNDPASQNSRRDAARRAPVSVFSTPPSSCNTAGLMAMTFDQGISTTNTSKVLTALDTAGINATFHVSVEWLGLDLVNTIVKQIISRGHVLGFAWYAAGYGTDPRNLTTTALTAALTEQATKVYNVAGVWPRFIRFPDATLDGTTGTAVYATAVALGYQPTIWSIDTQDYLACTNSSAIASSISIFDTTLASYQNLTSSFITLHTDLCDVSTEITSIAATAKAAGYSFTTLDQCLGGTSYKASATSYSSSSTTTTSSSSATVSALSASSSLREWASSTSFLIMGLVAALVVCLGM